MYARLLQREIAEEKRRGEEQCAEQLTEHEEALNNLMGLLSATQMELDVLKRDNDALKTQLQSLPSRQEEDVRTSVSVGTQTNDSSDMGSSIHTGLEVSMLIETDTRKRPSPGTENKEEEGLPKKARNEKRR
jgi:hypothetical protein